MFYKASDAATSTGDWVSLSVDAVPQSLIALALEKDESAVEEILCDLPSPKWRGYLTEDEERMGVTLFPEPVSTDYAADAAEDFAHDHAAWKAYDAEAREEIGIREEREALPMWGTMWSVEDHPRIREAAAAAGFRLYDASAIDLGLLLGLDGGGYSFFGAHWIPLRASLALGPCKREAWHKGPALTSHRRFVAKLATMLRAEAAREGERPRCEVAIAALENAAK